MNAAHRGLGRRFATAVAIAAALSSATAYQWHIEAQAAYDPSAGIAVPFPTGTVYFNGPHTWAGDGVGSWNSLDLESSPGNHSNTVYAATSGRVHTKECHRSTDYVRIDPSDNNTGWQTTYAHLVNVQVGDGAWVNRGDLIGYTGNPVGQCGRGNTIHTHFSIWYVAAGGSFNLGSQSQEVDWGGVDRGGVDVGNQPVIGDWIWTDGSYEYTGTVTNVNTGSTAQCNNSNGCIPTVSMYNDGAISGPSRIDVITRGGDGNLYQRYWSNGVGNMCTSAPCAANMFSRPAGVSYFASDPAATWRLNNSEFDTFAEGNNSNLYQWYYNGTGNWCTLGAYPQGTISSDTPAVAAPAAGSVIDLFVIRSGILYWAHYSSATGGCLGAVSWNTPNVSQPVSFLSHPGAAYATSGGTNTLAVFVLGSDYQNYETYTLDGSHWVAWTPIGGYPEENPPYQYAAGAAAANYPDGSRYDELVTSAYSGNVFDKYYITAWSSWSQVAGQPVQAWSDAGAAWWLCYGWERIDFFVQGDDGNLWGRYFLTVNGSNAWVNLNSWPGGPYYGNGPAVAVWR